MDIMVMDEAAGLQIGDRSASFEYERSKRDTEHQQSVRRLILWAVCMVIFAGVGGRSMYLSANIEAILWSFLVLCLSALAGLFMLLEIWELADQ